MYPEEELKKGLEESREREREESFNFGERMDRSLGRRMGGGG